MVITAGVLNFRMAASYFVSITEEAMKEIKKIQFQRAKNAIKFVVTLQKKDMKFLLVELN